MDSSSISRIGDMLTLIKPSGRFISLTVGDTVEAEVLNMQKGGEVSLRIAGETISAKTDIPFAKGTVVLLKVLGFEKDLKLQFLGVEAEDLSQSIQSQKSLSQNVLSIIPEKILEVLSGFADAKLSSRDIQVLTDIFKSLPGEIRSEFPELDALEKFLPEIQNLNSQLLKASFENSGLFLEVKLKVAAQEMHDEELAAREARQEQSGQEMSEKGEAITSRKQLQHVEARDVSAILDRAIREDLKGILLKTRDLFQDVRVTEALRLSGIKLEQAGEIIDRIGKAIEFFQMSSKVNEMLHTFLPVSWHELRDGELIFKRSKDRRTDPDAYCCTLNLDLASTGKMSISVTMYEEAFYVSFRVEAEKTRTLLNSHKSLLEKQFADAGISLKAVNFQTDTVAFGEPPGEGFHIQV